MTEEVQQDQEVEATISESLSGKIQEITECTKEQADEATTLIGVLISEAVQFAVNDTDFVHQLFNNMLATQVNKNNKLLAIEDSLNRAEWIVVDEEHPSSNLRVHYNGEETFEWIFERIGDNGWEPLEITEEQRNNLVVIAGKYFDGRIDRTGYIIDARDLADDK